MIQLFNYVFYAAFGTFVILFYILILHKVEESVTVSTGYLLKLSTEQLLYVELRMTMAEVYFFDIRLKQYVKLRN